MLWDRNALLSYAWERALTREKGEAIQRSKKWLIATANAIERGERLGYFDRLGTDK